MKTRRHTASAFGAALFCTTAWFAVWLTAFHPLPPCPEQAPVRPATALRPALTSEARTLTRPTLFSLPSEQGFSGTFPESRVHLDLGLDHPEQPDFYLPRERVAKSAPDQIQFAESVSLPQAGQLSLPGTAKTAAALQPGLYFFLSSTLQARAPTPLLSDLSTPMPETTRIQLRIEADGTVSQCFFETPVTNPALPAAIRSLRFNPAPQATDGWLEIRSIPKEDI